ncbi:uncharacterized protein KY384_005382 [Bacidia gigantensis]|uniref:uncharacterized protein n=1 Tax=Bacidia gigantensis TaxID=2732470 RepID=UPI001D056814|nr:uncharacterized protein KY384_005382 [Bacidia gigantensis]KAG8529901.1 hypothetical protein KY384_005382 [Bacidia gigantensis]
MAQRASRSDFEAFFPTLVKDVSEHVQQYNLPEDALKWFQESLKYNTANGKLNRGLAVLDTASILLDRPLNQTEYTHLATLGWLTELLQAFFLVSDDIMDSSHTRRGADCWYRRPEVGMVAINDAFMLESAIYVLLKKYFRQHESYVDLLELFHEVTMKTEAGQLCDLLIAPEDRVDLSKFTYEKSKFIMTYKTAYYSFGLPVALALFYLRLATTKNWDQSHDILIATGVYFQVQDDYLDVYGSPEEIGKIGTDIQENKCGWAINEALPLCDARQKAILEENYGRKDKEKELKVKQVFKELDLPQRYLDFEEKEVARIRQMIASIDESEGLKKGVFESFLNKIYKRSK